MIIEIPNENSIVKWKNDEKDEWKYAEISDLIKAYESPKVTVFAENASKEEIEDFKQELENVLERPQGDLISREALKKAINDNGCRHSHYFDIFDVIDNAPTVGRPQGKWEVSLQKDILGRWNSYYKYKCSVCHKSFTDYEFIEYPFCQFCGASMEVKKNDRI